VSYGVLYIRFAVLAILLVGFSVLIWLSALAIELRLLLFCGTILPQGLAWAVRVAHLMRDRGVQFKDEGIFVDGVLVSGWPTIKERRWNGSQFQLVLDDGRIIRVSSNIYDNPGLVWELISTKSCDGPALASGRKLDLGPVVMYLGLSLGFVYGPVLAYTASTIQTRGHTQDLWIWAMRNLSIWLAFGWAVLLRAETSRANLAFFAFGSILAGVLPLALHLPEQWPTMLGAAIAIVACLCVWRELHGRER